MADNGTGRRRVVVTGIGAVSSLGNDAETSWANLLAGESGAGPITQFDTDGYPVRFACELKDFQQTDWMDHKSSRRMDRFAQMILAAAPDYRERTFYLSGPPEMVNEHERTLRGLGVSRSQIKKDYFNGLV